MKTKTLLLALIALALTCVSGCTTTGGQKLSPAQIAAIACPQVNLVNSQLTVINAAMLASPATASFAQKANAELVAIQPTVAAVCAAGANVTATNLQALAQQALPALGTIVGTLPITPAQQAQAQAGLVVAETALGLAGVVEQQIQAAKAQGAPARASSVK
ncbi:MAG TPA: hypothetical protein VN731_10140 [Rhodanobacter sp.]|nr:hypothetical protein [Rhodanobacter sp.]